MADNSNNILKQLQQYAIEPPAEVFGNAWQVIIGENEAGRKKAFAQLQEYELHAPALNFEAVKKATLQPPVAAGKKRLVLSPPLLKVASVLLLLAGATVIYLTLFRTKENNAANYAGQGVENNTAHEKELKDKGERIEPVNTNTIAPANDNTTGSNNTIVGKKSGDKVTLEERNIPFLYDNDILLTLVNYREYNNRQPLFTGVVTDKKITLNKYSYVNISDNMVAMLQNMYATKKNGKPSRKAKRTKKKIDKWRKEDEKYFDRNMQKNPADITDLSDILL